MIVRSIIPMIRRRARKAARYMSEEVLYLLACVGTRRQSRRRLARRVIERPVTSFVGPILQARAISTARPRP